MAKGLTIRPTVRTVGSKYRPGVIVVAGLGLVGLGLAGLGLAGCSPAGHAPSGSLEGRVTVAPRIVFSLPPPAALDRAVEASQLVTAHYRNETFVFETHISVTPARLLAVGTDMLGRRAMTIEWTGSDLKVEAAPWVPPTLRARNVVADIMLVHWPESAVRAGLGPGATLRASGSTRRVIAIDGHDTIRIDRAIGSSERWSGRWSYRNLGLGYDLDIQSSEPGP